ncbi:MAG: glycosyltransferase family 4 protein [Bacteroidota bacterium]
MQVKQRHITFLSPTMKRTGSEIVLYNLISRISENYFVKLISVYKGELLFRLDKKHLIYYVHNERPHSILSKIGFKIKEYLFFKILKANRFSTWYINTIVLWDYLEFAEKNNIKVILHVHELEQIFALLSTSQLQRVVNYPDLIIANSKYTSELVQQYGRTKPVELCYPAIDTTQVFTNTQTRSSYRKKMHIADDAFVWAMCGTLDDNKNPELFMDIAFELLKAKPATRFLWIGGTSDLIYADKIKATATHKNISDSILWMDSVGEEYLNYFQGADGFVLTSKKESFSIVTVEALLLGLPVVTHDCGGVKEILKNDVGTIVSEKDNVDQFVKAMISYMDDPSLHNKTKGIEIAKEFDIEIWSKKWNTILDTYIK